MKRLILLFVVGYSAFAQSPTYRVDPSPLMTTAGIAPALGYPQLFAVPGAQISLCSDSACANPVASYTGNTTATACPVTAPITYPGSAICQTSTGQQGQYGFWLAAGSYYYSVFPPNATSPICCFALTVGGGGTVSFQGTPNPTSIVIAYSSAGVLQTPNTSSTLDGSGNLGLGGTLTTCNGCTGSGLIASEQWCDTGCTNPTTVASFSTGPGITINGPLTATPFLFTVGTPASSSAACTAGQIQFDSSYIYACTATNTWKRVGISGF